MVLHSLAELDMALRKNKAYMGSRYIEVFEARKLVGAGVGGWAGRQPWWPASWVALLGRAAA